MRVPPQPPTLTRAQRRVKHQRLWAACRACLVEAPAGPSRTASGAPASGTDRWQVKTAGGVHADDGARTSLR
jgi:hypothetical protein